jgi:hypothetical protein
LATRFTTRDTVASDTPAWRATVAIDRIEQAVRDEVEHALITIHVEPDNKAKHSGVLVL